MNKSGQQATKELMTGLSRKYMLAKICTMGVEQQSYTVPADFLFHKYFWLLH
jgi:hypothetical protein